MTVTDRPLRLGFDMDGLFVDFNTACIAKMNAMFNVGLPPVSDSFPDIYNYDRANLTREQFDTLWAHIQTVETRFWKQLGELPSADLLRDISDMMDGCQVTAYFITTRPGRNAHAQSMQWLSAHGFRNPTVLIADNEPAKGKLAVGLGLHAFIDDKPENCQQVKLQSPATKVFILNQPYNKTIQFNDITRVWHVREMLEQLGLIERKPGALEQAFLQKVA